MSRPVCGRCLVGTLLTKGSHGDASLWPKNDGKSRKWEEVKEITGKMWKKEGKRKKGYKNENWRKWEKREKWVRKEEKKREGKVGKPRGRWACYTIPQMSLECCSPFPVRLCLKSDHVRTVSKKKCKIEQSEHRIVTTTVDIKCSTRDMFGESSFRELFTWDGSPDLSGINVRKVRKIITKTWKKRQFDVQNWPKEGPTFQKSFRQQESRISFYRTLSFFPRKKW